MKIKKQILENSMLNNNFMDTNINNDGENKEKIKIKIIVPSNFIII